jgi:methyl-accepting chemotaxis protein
LIEDIAKAFYAEAKTRGETKNAYAIQAEDGTALLDYDPTATGTEDYKRDTTAIGVKTLAQMELPAADVSLKEPSGVELHNHHGDIDGAAWTKTDGAMGFAGFNWIVINHQPSEELFADLVATKQLLITLMVIAAIAIAVVGLVVGTLAARPIKKLALDINNLAEGDYTRDLDGANRSDEIGDMVKSLNNNVHKIREIVSSIKHAAGSVNAAASEIAAGSSDLSMRTEQQASSLEETAASMEEITGTVKQNSENAVHANNLSGNANKVATEGGRVVEEAVVAMKSIESSSQKISDIISVIDEIAFQTNLLALNAAVEAARAGDAGKGFAVVASEVRALAGRSASASKEIKALINESASQVKTGASLVNQAGDTLKGIVTSIKEVAGIVSEISSASMQQSTGIDEINSAVSQMDEATQQNAALVEENTAAAQSMLEQAKALENLITFFKVEEGAEVAHEETHTPEPIKTFKPAVKKVTKPAVKKPAAKVTPHVNGHVNGGSHDAGWEQF